LIVISSTIVDVSKLTRAKAIPQGYVSLFPYSGMALSFMLPNAFEMHAVLRFFFSAIPAFHFKTSSMIASKKALTVVPRSCIFFRNAALFLSKTRNVMNPV
jgi:hypothetical protein